MFLNPRRLLPLLFLCVVMVGLSPLAAQDEPISPPPTETVIPTVPPTETATELPSATPLPTDTPTDLPTLTETPLPVPTASETATATATGLPTDIETPTLQPSETPPSTLTAVAPFSPSPSPTGTGTATAASTSTATLSELPILYSDTFESPQFDQWYADIYQSIVSVDNGHALHVTNVNSYLGLSQGSVLDVVFQADINLSSGIASFGVRRSQAGYYRVALNTNGTVTLFRAEQALATAYVNAFVSGQWRTVKFSVTGNTLRVVIDNTEVLNFTDLSALPSGIMFVAGNVETINDFLIDNLVIQGTIAPSQPPISTPSLLNQSSAQMLNSLLSEGTSQRIVTSKNVNTTGIQNQQIFIMDECGENQIQLTSGSGNYWTPDLNLNGEIVFVAENLGAYDILTMNADGTNVDYLTFDPYPKYSPSWSPDGSQIVFGRGSGINTLTLETLSEYSLNIALPGSKLSPKWSPTDNRIAFHVYDENTFNVYTFDLTNNDINLLTDDDHSSQPAWSPDGTEIVLKHSSGSFDWLDVIDSHTGEPLRQITPEITDGIQFPSWSVDGSTILYSVQDPVDPSKTHYIDLAPSQSSQSTGCTFGRLPGERYGFADYGLVLSGQVTATPTQNTKPPDTPTIEECENGLYQWWVKRRHDEDYPSTIIAYQSHHGAPDIYFENLVDLIASDKLAGSPTIDFLYDYNEVPTIQMPYSLHKLINREWARIRAEINASIGNWKDGTPWEWMSGTSPSVFSPGAYIDRLNKAGFIPDNCVELYTKALKEYLQYILCKVSQVALQAVIANPASTSAEILKEIVDWLGGVDAIFDECPSSWS